MNTELLAKLIDAKLHCLEQLLDLGRRQYELIDEGRMTALLDLLVTKGNTLEQLQKIERALDPIRDQPPEQRQWPSEELRQQCNERLQQCEAMLQEIIQQERQSETTLIERRDQVDRQLQGVHHAGLARAAYTHTPMQTIGQLDLHSD
jgi:hypothetical protein